MKAGGRVRGRSFGGPKPRGSIVFFEAFFNKELFCAFSGFGSFLGRG